MSSHRHHVGGGSGRNAAVGVPIAPPPPVLSSSRQGGRNVRRSRSRSRSPRVDRSSIGSRFRQEVRQRGTDRIRGRIRTSRSPSPFSSGPNVSSNSYRSSKTVSTPPPVKQTQSISLITGEGSLPIIRRILDPDLVKIPRRVGEGGRPIFERDELKEGMRRRFAADDDDDGRGRSLGPPLVPEQRVIAIIREPAPSRNMMSDSYRLPSTTRKELDHPGYAVSSRMPQLEPPPSHHRAFRERPYQPHQRSMSPPTRDRGGDLRSSNRDRGRPSVPAASSIERPTVDRERIRGSNEDRGEQNPVRISKDRLERERPVQLNSRLSTRSPPVRISRERISRSHSRTPPPMPAEIRRQMLDRERDLRSKLSRPARFPAKFDPNQQQQQDFRGSNDSGSFRGRGSGFIRGRGGSFRGREESRSRGFWEHDMFERDGLDGDLKSNKT